MKPPKIAFVGDLTADIYMPQRDIRLGGAAYNAALWAKRLGARAKIFSCVGSDVVGEKFPHSENIQKKRGKTSAIEIFVSKDGERQYGTWNPGVLVKYHFRNKDKKILRTMDAIVVTVYPFFEHILKEIPVGPLVVINYGDLKEFDRRIDVVVRNMKIADILIFGLDKDEDEQLINDILLLASMQNKMAIVTLGKYGSIAWLNGKSFIQPAQEVKPVDTTGAGDSFLSAFLVSYLKTNDIQKSLNSGTDLASKVIQKVGAY